MGTTRRSSTPDDPFMAASIAFATKRPNTVFRCCLPLYFASDSAEDEVDEEAPPEGRGAERAKAEDEDDEPLLEGEGEARGGRDNAGGAASTLIAP